MSQNERTPENDDRDETVAGMEAAHLDSSPSDDELLRIWERLKPQTPSAAFQRRMAIVLESLRREREADADFGVTLMRLREAANLSIATLRQRVQIDGGVLQDLERNALYPENLPEVFWRRYAEALMQTTLVFADLIASYDRTKVVLGGMAAARATQGMPPEQRAAFLGQPEGEVRARLDERRDALVAALRR